MNMRFDTYSDGIAINGVFVKGMVAEIEFSRSGPWDSGTYTLKLTAPCEIKYEAVLHKYPYGGQPEYGPSSEHEEALW